MRNSSCNLCSNWLQNPKLHKSYAYLLFALVNCPALCHNILQNCSGSSLPSFVAFFEAQNRSNGICNYYHRFWGSCCVIKQQMKFLKVFSSVGTFERTRIESIGHTKHYQVSLKVYIMHKVKYGPHVQNMLTVE